MAGIEDLIPTFRGETINLNPFRKRWSSLMNAFDKARVGKYSTTAAKEAMKYASNKFPNKILKAMITPLELKIGQKMFHELEPHYTDQGVKTKRIRKQISKFIRDKGGINYNILSTKNKNKLKIDILKTIASNAKALTPLATKGLTFLTSLPVSTLIMTLQSTPVNADEANMQLEDFAKLAEKNNLEMGSNMDKALPIRSKDI